MSSDERMMNTDLFRSCTLYGLLATSMTTVRKVAWKMDFILVDISK